MSKQKDKVTSGLYWYKVQEQSVDRQLVYFDADRKVVQFDPQYRGVKIQTLPATFVLMKSNDQVVMRGGSK